MSYIQASCRYPYRKIVVIRAQELSPQPQPENVTDGNFSFKSHIHRSLSVYKDDRWRGFGIAHVWLSFITFEAIIYQIVAVLRVEHATKVSR